MTSIGYDGEKKPEQPPKLGVARSNRARVTI